jgi:ABC-type multidrug transport system ATPase subunit
MCVQKRVKSARNRNLSFPFDPVTLAFKDLHYYVPGPTGSDELELLKGVSGVFRPRILTALMGASGAGKTTLMDVLAGVSQSSIDVMLSCSQHSSGQGQVAPVYLRDYMLVCGALPCRMVHLHGKWS